MLMFSKAGIESFNGTRQLLALFLSFGVLFAAAPDTTPAEDTRNPYKPRIIRDTYGVPHIIGKTSADVGYGLGRSQCEDRAVDVVHNLHAGSGRLAELAGEQYLDNDREA